jgi:hypothetical protein
MATPNINNFVTIKSNERNKIGEYSYTKCQSDNFQLPSKAVQGIVISNLRKENTLRIRNVLIFNNLFQNIIVLRNELHVTPKIIYYQPPNILHLTYRVSRPIVPLSSKMWGPVFRLEHLDYPTYIVCFSIRSLTTKKKIGNINFNQRRTQTNSELDPKLKKSSEEQTHLNMSIIIEIIDDPINLCPLVMTSSFYYLFRIIQARRN